MPPAPEELLLANGQKVSEVIRGETYSVKYAVGEKIVK
jgi:hypothetical protein